MSGVPEEIFKSLVEASQDFIGTIDRKGNLLYLNAAARQMLEIPLDEDIIGHSIVPYNDKPSEELAQSASRIIADNQIAGVGMFVSRSGKRIAVSQSFIVHETPLGTHYSTIARDISDRVALEQSLREQADRDPLTGLLNRTAFRRRAADWFKTSGSHLAMIDLDGFKNVNDVHGHHVGDTLLVDIAEVLMATIEPHGLVARLGGDEFAIIVNDVDIETVLHVVLGPVLSPFGAGVSVGVVVFDEAVDLEVALRLADDRLYAKKGGRRRNESNPQVIAS